MKTLLLLYWKLRVQITVTRLRIESYHVSVKPGESPEPWEVYRELHRAMVSDKAEEAIDELL